MEVGPSTPAAVEFLESEAGAVPELAAAYGELAQLYTSKLWHQLTSKLEEVVRLELFAAAGGSARLVALYEKFIADVEDKLNLLRLARIVVAIAERCTAPGEAIAFLDPMVAKMSEQKNPEQPTVFLQMHIAQLHLAAGEAGQCKELVEEALTKLGEMTEVDPSVSAAVYGAAAQLAKAKQDVAGFYKNALLHLAYTSVDALPVSTQRDFAVDLSLAALLGENVFNFAELIAHPVMRSLAGTSFAWLEELLHCFNRGDLQQYDELCYKYADQLNAQPALVQNERKLREKITILALMEIIFHLPADDRTIELTTIAEKTKLPLDGVEFLLMKTLSVHLIEGIIDQVEGTVRVSWVQPRVLLMPQIEELKGRLQGWKTKVHSALVTVEGESPELLGVA